MMNLPHPFAHLRRFAAALALLATHAVLPAQAKAPLPPPAADVIAVPAGNVVSFHTYALGVQVWRWDTTTNNWAFVEPIALLFPSANLAHPFGLHFAGPTWVLPSGSGVVGSVLAATTVDPTAVPWLLLRAVSSYGPGPLEGTTYIQRVNTVSGRAPNRVGTAGEVVWVPYTAEYYFYRAQ